MFPYYRRIAIMPLGSYAATGIEAGKVYEVVSGGEIACGCGKGHAPKEVFMFPRPNLPDTLVFLPRSITLMAN